MISKHKLAEYESDASGTAHEGVLAVLTHVEVPTCLVRREYLFSHANRPVYDESVRSSRKRHHCMHQC
jgi:hypothetical protein